MLPCIPRCILLDSIDSTHLFAKRECHLFAPDGLTWISAEEQTAGRGHKGRVWFSPPRVNLYLTLYFQIRPHQHIALACMAQLMAWSLAALCLQHGLAPQFKWPNDLLIQGKKLCGILAEIKGHELFLSAGINVNMECDKFPPLDQPITSLYQETGERWNRALLLQEFQIQFTTDLDRLWASGFAPFAQSIASILANRGQSVQVEEDDLISTGIIQGIAPDGRLQLLLPDQTLRLLSSGRIKK